MRVLPFVDPSLSPILREEELMEELRAAGLSRPEWLHLTIAGRRLFLDGYADSLDEKFETEETIKHIAPDCLVINRLRVAAGLVREVS